MIFSSSISAFLIRPNSNCYFVNFLNLLPLAFKITLRRSAMRSPEPMISSLGKSLAKYMLAEQDNVIRNGKIEFCP